MQEAISKALEELKQSSSPDRLMQQIKLRRQLAELEKQAQMGAYKKRLTDKQMVIDSTADESALIKRGLVESEQLGAIFLAVPGEIVCAGCLPTYRDAIAFYNEQGQLLRVLNSCFEWLYMEATDGVSVESGTDTYDALRKLLSLLGHPIENAGN